MALLFIIEGKVVKPYPETLLIPPFQDIWCRDDSKGKEIALKEFTYIEFMSSKFKSNPYKGYTPTERSKKIIEDCIMLEDWKPDAMVQAGIDKCEEFQTKASSNYSLLMDTLTAKENLQKLFRKIDLQERNDKGLPVYKPKELTSAMYDVDKLATSLYNLEKKVEEELYDAVKIKGQKEVSPFADPNFMK